MKIIRILVIIVIVGILAGLYFAKNKNNESEVNSAPAQKVSVEELNTNDKPLIIDFGATWCGPCKAFHPILEKMTEKYKDTVTIKYIDVDENPNISNKYPVEAIPCQVFIKADGTAYIPTTKDIELTTITNKDGKKVTYHVGGLTEEEFEAIINDIVK